MFVNAKRKNSIRANVLYMAQENIDNLCLVGHREVLVPNNIFSSLVCSFTAATWTKQEADV